MCKFIFLVRASCSLAVMEVSLHYKFYLRNYSATTWLLTAIGESYLLSGDYENANDVLQQAMHCPDAIGNPFIHLILGQAQFELGNFARAKDNLARAYMGGGKEIFQGDDPKYYEYLKTLMRDIEL